MTECVHTALYVSHQDRLLLPSPAEFIFLCCTQAYQPSLAPLLAEYLQEASSLVATQQPRYHDTSMTAGRKSIMAEWPTESGGSPLKRSGVFF